MTLILNLEYPISLSILFLVLSRVSIFTGNSYNFSPSFKFGFRVRVRITVRIMYIQRSIYINPNPNPNPNLNRNRNLNPKFETLGKMYKNAFLLLSDVLHEVREF